METAWTCCCLFAHSIRGFKKIIESWDDGCHKLELLWVWLIQTRTIGLAAEIQCLAAQTQLLWHPCRFQRNTKQWNTTTAQKKINRVVGYKQLQVLSVLGKLIHRDQFNADFMNSKSMLHYSRHYLQKDSHAVESNSRAFLFLFSLKNFSLKILWILFLWNTGFV